MVVVVGGGEKSLALLRRVGVARSQGDSRGCPGESAGKQTEPQEPASGVVRVADTLDTPFPHPSPVPRGWCGSPLPVVSPLLSHPTPHQEVLQ